MNSTTSATHIVHVNFAWSEKTVELARRRRRFDVSIFSAVRMHVEINLPMRVNSRDT